MRIAVVSAPKSGNHWVKCLLGRVYGLRWLPGPEKAEKVNPPSVRRWVRQGGWPDGSILHQHSRFTSAMADALESAPGRIVTIVRDPYDLFVSLYEWSQMRAARGLGNAHLRPRHTLVGDSIDRPEVLDYLRDDFGSVLQRAHGWATSGRAVVLRYEQLHADAVRALRDATAALVPVGDDDLRAAIERCRAENMRAMNATLAWHVRSARVGESAEVLGAAHLEIIRACHAEVITALGYTVR